jgi:heterodisulfide reductase subunit D
MFLTDEEKKLTIEGCRFCPMCFHADTVVGITCKETQSPRGRGLILFGLENGVLKWDDPAVSDVLFKSFTDGLPQEWCAGHYDHDELIIDARHHLVEKGWAPDEIKRAAARILETGSPYDAVKTDGDVLKESITFTTSGADLLVFSGCAARSLHPASLRSFVKILKTKGIPFQLLNPEPCCGMPLYQLGDFTHAAQQARDVSQKIAASGAKEVVCLDADCFRMLTTRFARFGASLPDGLKVSHVSEWLSRTIVEEKWIFKKRSERVTYHDPCSLARFTRVHEPPRVVLASLFVREILEMFGSFGKASCCGEGGGMILTNPEIVHEAARRRFEQACNTGAELLVTSSPACAALLSEVRTDGPIVRDLVEMVAESM